jgi:hypothetical protein
MQFQKEYEAIRTLYYKKLSICSEMLTIEPSLIKLWRLACMPDMVEIIDMTETLTIEKLPMQTCTSENFFYLLAVMQFSLFLVDDSFAFSFLKEIEKFGMRIIERKQIYLFSDLKKESVKMMGAGILSMTDFQIENATHNIVEMTLRVKLDHKNLKKQIKLKRIETILD